MDPNAFDTLILPACRGIVPGLVVGGFSLMLGASAGVVIDMVVTLARVAAKWSDLLRGQPNPRTAGASPHVGPPLVGFRINSGSERIHGHHYLP